MISKTASINFKCIFRKPDCTVSSQRVETAHPPGKIYSSELRHMLQLKQATALSTPAIRPVKPAHLTNPRILLYSHDTFGLGNIRRTLLLAQEVIEQYPKAA